MKLFKKRSASDLAGRSLNGMAWRRFRHNRLAMGSLAVIVLFALMALLGYQPEVDSCAACGKEIPDSPVLDLRGGALYCHDCALEALAQRPKALDAGSLQALRFILFSPRSRVFSFQLREGSLRRLGDIAEAYVAEQMERGFRTLDYYKSI